jgi:hypothetical protein
MGASMLQACKAATNVKKIKIKIKKLKNESK